MAKDSGYSATVGLALVIDGVKHAISHVGPRGILIRSKCDPMPPGMATLLVRVDDSRKKYDVFLPDGVPGPGTFVRFEKLPPPSQRDIPF